MLPHLLEALSGSWQHALQDVVLVPPLHALQIGSPAGEARKVTFLVFNEGASEPVLLLKVVRESTYQAQLQQEFAVLKRLWQRRELRGTVPQPLGLFGHAGRLVMIEAFLPGTPLTVLWRRRSQRRPEAVAAHFQEAEAWLNVLQNACRGKGPPAVSREPVTWQAVTLRLQQLPPPPLPGRFLAELQKLVETYRDVKLAPVSSHGDYWPGNLFWRDTCDGHVAVADWETFNTARPPYYDFFHFLTTYVQSYPWRLWRRPSRAERFRRGFLDDTWLARLVASSITSHLQQLGLPPAAARLFYPLFLLQMAAPATDESEKQGQQAIAWQETLRHYAIAPVAARQRPLKG